MRKASFSFAFLIGPLLVSATAFAQAWLPPKGEASFSFSYGNSFVKKHYFQTDEFEGGHIRSNTVLIDVGYGITERLAVNIGIPYVSSKYYGPLPHTLAIDDGTYHGTFQDYRIDLRYQALKAPFVATPFVAAIIPSHNYTFFAHSAAGRDLHEYLLGINLGRRLDPILSDGYVQARYSYAFVERVLGIRHDRSNVDLELGYFVTPSLGVRALGLWQYTHGGFEIPIDIEPFDPGNPRFFHHDQLSRDNFLNIGGGLSYALTGSVDVFASYIKTVSGRNGHKIQQGLTVGASWSFSPTQVVRRYFPKKSPKLGSAIQ